MRFITYFGVALPPWKEEKLGAGAVTIRFVLTGNIISKKNNEQAITVRKKAREHLNVTYKRSGRTDGLISLKEAHKAIGMTYAKMRGNMEYLKFLERVKPIFQEQMQFWSARLQKKGLLFPLSKSSVSIRLYIKDRYRRDTHNAEQTIYDALKDSGVIIDDNDSVINPKHAGSARYYDELIYNIAFISMSFKLEPINND